MLRFTVATIPAMADVGNATLYFMNRSRTYGYCFSDCTLNESSYNGKLTLTPTIDMTTDMVFR